MARRSAHELPDGLQAPRAHEGASRRSTSTTRRRASPRRSLLIKKRELDKLHKTLGGIRNLTRTPSALWIVDTKKEHLAVDEAQKLGIPIIGILDTNCDPDEITYPIPGNDDAIRSVGLLTRIVADAAAEGLKTRHNGGDEAEAEPLAEWEQEAPVR